MADTKGKKNGTCNRTACQKPENVVFFNHSTREFYCSECAVLLNDTNRDWAMDAYGHDLCVTEDGLTPKEFRRINIPSKV